MEVKYLVSSHTETPTTCTLLHAISNRLQKFISSERVQHDIRYLIKVSQ